MFCGECGTQIPDGTTVCPKCGAGKKPTIVVDYKKIQSAWGGLANNSDCCIYPVPNDIASQFRANFNVNYSETMLMIRDTSCWNSRDQGLCITDQKIYLLADNDSGDAAGSICWADITHVDYKDNIFYFFGNWSDTNNVPIHASFFVKDEDKFTNYVANKMMNYFNGIAKATEPEEDPISAAISAAEEQFTQLCADKEYKKAADLGQKCKDEFGDYTWGLFIYLRSSGSHYHLGNYQKSIDICDEVIKVYKDVGEGDLAAYALYQKYSNIINAAEKSDEYSWDYAALRRYSLEVTKTIPSDYNRGDGVLVIDDSKNDFKEYDCLYAKNFLSLPYNQRKILVPVNEYTTLDQESIAVIKTSNLPPEIEFPIGHPITNQMYVGHPYVSHKYIPFDSYELELVEDKVREFCQIAQSLGAEEIQIGSTNSTSSDHKTNSERNISGGGKFGMFEGSGFKGDTVSSGIINEISQTISLHQKYSPKGAAKLPAKLVWYGNEPSWQRLFEQRMSGSLTHHEEKIELRKSRVVDGMELTTISGEFKNLILAANGSWNNKIEEKFEAQKNEVLSILVDFAPLDMLTEGNSYTPQKSISSTSFTFAEQEYLDEYTECLAVSEEVTSSERRLLKRLQKSLDISDERAAELEASLTPAISLTDDEKDYVEEYKLCLENGGEITDSERRLLDRFRNKLGISEERAAEIEKLK